MKPSLGTVARPSQALLDFADCVGGHWILGRIGDRVIAAQRRMGLGETAQVPRSSRLGDAQRYEMETAQDGSLNARRGTECLSAYAFGEETSTSRRREFNEVRRRRALTCRPSGPIVQVHRAWSGKCGPPMARTRRTPSGISTDCAPGGGSAEALVLPIGGRCESLETLGPAILAQALAKSAIARGAGDREAGMSALRGGHSGTVSSTTCPNSSMTV